MKKDKDISELPFEEALQELESIANLLEKGEVPLKESIDLYERGALLKNHCDLILEKARIRINQISNLKTGESSIMQEITPIDTEDIILSAQNVNK